MEYALSLEITRRDCPISEYKATHKIALLANRRRLKRLTNFYMYSRGQLVINNLPTLHLAGSRGRVTRSVLGHVLTINEAVLDGGRTDYARQSYLYRTVTEWNSLPEYVVLSEDSEVFKREAGQLVLRLH